MSSSAAAHRRFLLAGGVTAALSTAWIGLLVSGKGGPEVAQAVSNLGLIVAAYAAACACHRASLRDPHHDRVWLFLAASAFAWGSGQLARTWYESVLGTDAPVPSLADVGFLLAPLLAATALLRLPHSEQSVPGRARAVMDGLMIAGSLLLTSWVLVLEPLFHTTAEGLPRLIGLAYPLSTVLVVTIALYVLLPGGARRSSIPLGLIAVALVSIAVADSGFAYQTGFQAGTPSSLICAGWLLGFALLVMAAIRPVPAEPTGAEASDTRLGLILPNTAVVMGLAVSSLELLRTGTTDALVFWIRNFIFLALVTRQILTLGENRSLTRRLRGRVVELRASEQRFEALVQHSSDVVTVIEADRSVLYQSESIERVFGYPADALLGRSLDDLLDADSSTRLAETVSELTSQPYGIRALELQVRHRSGRFCQTQATITNLLAKPSVGGFVLNMRDISEQKTLEDQLVYSAFHDSLTALANRALFRDRVDETLQANPTRDKGIAVLFLDLDGFKQVNDLLGHASGDLLLVQVAERLRACVRPEDTVARLGGDEFAVLLDGGDDQVAIGVAERITSALRDAFRVDHQEIHVRGSVGLAIATSDVSDADKLLRNADLAMYRAKAAGQGSFELYDPGMHTELVERLQLEADLRRGIERHELVLEYQPIVQLATGKIVGVEALVRWKHPTRGFMPPGCFVPLAEESGLIVPMGRWVLRRACRQMSWWQRLYPDAELTISVNISGEQLMDGFPEQVEALLRELELKPSRLVLEMTESVLMDNTDANLSLFRQLKDIGVRLAIDDFGTGYSSLSYLHRFPVDILKIDRSFVELLGSNNADSELVRTIVKLGQSLQMRTIAEGIEDDDHVRILQGLECEFGQGYHFSRPLTDRQVEKYLSGADAEASLGGALDASAVPVSREAA